jgi:hypothetical protein
MRRRAVWAQRSGIATDLLVMQRLDRVRRMSRGSSGLGIRTIGPAPERAHPIPVISLALRSEAAPNVIRYAANQDRDVNRQYGLSQFKRAVAGGHSSNPNGVSCHGDKLNHFSVSIHARTKSLTSPNVSIPTRQPASRHTQGSVGCRSENPTTAQPASIAIVSVPQKPSLVRMRTMTQTLALAARRNNATRATIPQTFVVLH